MLVRAKHIVPETQEAPYNCQYYYSRRSSQSTSTFYLWFNTYYIITADNTGIGKCAWEMLKCISSPPLYRCPAAAAAKSLQSCPTLCDPTDGSPPGSPVPGILQARTLEWVAISFSDAWEWKVKVKLLSHVQLLATPWTAAYQAPPSMGFSRHAWKGVPLPSPPVS